MYVLDPLYIKTADKDLDDLQSMTKFIQDKLTEMQAKENTKSESSADPELAEKVKKGLKGKRYTDKETGTEISFGTAYARGNEQAKADFNKGMDKAKAKKETEGGAGSSKGEEKKEQAPPKKSISQIDPVKTKSDAKTLLKALRGHDKAKAVEQLKKIEQGSERGTLDAIIELLSQPELQDALGMSAMITPPKPKKPKAPIQVQPSQPNAPANKPSQVQPPAPSQPNAPTNKPSQPTQANKPTAPAQPVVVAPPPSAPPPVVETGVSAKPKVDMSRVNAWVKKNKVPFNPKSFEKHLNTLDVDMDEKELDQFMASYTEAVKKKQNHSEYKKYRDVDLNKIKDPKELAKAMAIKKESEFYFNPLNGLGLDNLTVMNKANIQEHKEWIRETEKNRYAKMPAEDRKEMGNKLKAEMDKLDPIKDKEKIEVLESAYEGLLASAMFENNADEMQDLFDADPTEGMNPNEKKEYKEKKQAQRKERKANREKEIKNLEKINMPLNEKETKKLKENKEKIGESKLKAQGIDNKISEIQQQISKTKDKDELEKLNVELEKKEKAKEKTEKEIAKLEQDNYKLAIRDEGSLLKDIADYDDVKAELDALKEKLLKSQSNPKVKKDQLAKDQIAYKKLLEKKEKAKVAQTALRERENTANKIQSLKDANQKEDEDEENEKILDGSKITGQKLKVYDLSTKINELDNKKESGVELSEQEEEELKKLASEFFVAFEELGKLDEKEKELKEKELAKTKRYPVNQDIVAMVQTMDNPKVLGALMQMTKLKEQGSYKENLKTVFSSVSDEDLMAVVENTSVGEMAKLLGKDYCPEDVANKSTGRGDDDSDSKCSVTLSYAQKQEAREHLIDFISNEMYFTNADKGKTKAVSTKPSTSFDFDDDNAVEMAKEIEKKKQEEEKAKEKAKAEEKEKEEKEKEQKKKHEEEMKKYTKSFEDALRIPDENKRTERIKQITTDLNLAKASQAVRDEKSKAMIDAIRKIPDPRKRQEYLELLQKNDSDPPIFEKTKLGTDKNFNKVFINNNNNNKGLDFNMKKKSTTITNYQEVASTFRIGMKVFPFYGGSKDHHGTVVAIYPAIGMVDVQFPFGSARYPVEDLQIADLDIEPVQYDSIPGGLGTKPVNAKTALYWADKDRKYRMCRDEVKPTCPRCKGVELKKTIYKRVGGKSERLLCCPECLFLIKTTDILGFN